MCFLNKRPSHKTVFIAFTQSFFLDSFHVNTLIFGPEWNSVDQ